VKFKKICLIALCTLLVTVTFSGVVTAAPEDSERVYDLEYGGLIVEIRAPLQAYPGDTITITVHAEAASGTPLDVEYITVKLYGMLDATNNVTLREINHLETTRFTSTYEIDYNITIPENMSPGLTYGIVSCKWEVMGSPQKIPSSGFASTYIRNVDLEQLQTEYNQLNSTYQTLVENYTELESTLQVELDSTRNYMYIFVVTTVIAAITVVVLLMRKPQKIWI
jgi:hypothetical protein